MSTEPHRNRLRLDPPPVRVDPAFIAQLANAAAAARPAARIVTRQVVRVAAAILAGLLILSGAAYAASSIGLAPIAKLPSSHPEHERGPSPAAPTAPPTGGPAPAHPGAHLKPRHPRHPQHPQHPQRPGAAHEDANNADQGQNQTHGPSQGQSSPHPQPTPGSPASPSPHEAQQQHSPGKKAHGRPQAPEEKQNDQGHSGGGSSQAPSPKVDTIPVPSVTPNAKPTGRANSQGSDE